jgi:cobalt-precorrin 5A hydrolase
MLLPLFERHSASPPQVVAGLGCRRGCSMDELLDLLIHSLQSQQLTLDNLAGLASVIHKQGEPGLQALSERLGLALTCFTPNQLAPFQATAAGNALSLAVTGSPAVAEPSALALAARLGATPRLLDEKTRTASATCALATFDREPAA